MVRPLVRLGQTYKERVHFQIAKALFTPTVLLITMALQAFGFKNLVQILSPGNSLPLAFENWFLGERVTLLNFALAKGFTSNYLCRLKT